MASPSVTELTISQIRQILHADDPPGEPFLKELEGDARAGVRKMAGTARRRRKAEQAENARLERLFLFERKLRGQGDSIIAGVDEVGRGPLAGPVVAAAAVLPESVHLPHLNDSKALSPGQRDELYDRIGEVAVSWAIGSASPSEIDELNIFHASLLAMRRALDGLQVTPQRVLVDGKWTCGSRYPELALIKGDARSGSIAAASILAKVTRDRLMAQLDLDHPGYHLGRNKGYPSPDHLEALKELGPSPIHRRSFRAVSEANSKAGDPALHPDPPSQARPSRQAAGQAAGIRGEAIAEAELTSLGYRVLHRRFRAAGGEIDLIASRGADLCFVEVKSTHNPDEEPQSRIDAKKQHLITEAALAYIESNPDPSLLPRFDVITVDLSHAPPQVQFLQDAFRPHAETLDR